MKTEKSGAGAGCWRAGTRKEACAALITPVHDRTRDSLRDCYSCCGATSSARGPHTPPRKRGSTSKSTGCAGFDSSRCGFSKPTRIPCSSYAELRSTRKQTTPAQGTSTRQFGPNHARTLPEGTPRIHGQVSVSWRRMSRRRSYSTGRKARTEWPWREARPECKA